MKLIPGFDVGKPRAPRRVHAEDQLPLFIVESSASTVDDERFSPFDGRLVVTRADAGDDITKRDTNRPAPLIPCVRLAGPVGVTHEIQTAMKVILEPASRVV